MAGSIRYSCVSPASSCENLSEASCVPENGAKEASLLADDPMMKLSWYHPFLTRHSAECMLIDNANEGTYLLRPSSSGNNNEYSLSVKYSRSVQHMKLTRVADGCYKFGHSIFQSVDILRKHFEQEKPMVGGENGLSVVFKLPYPREIEEKHLYIQIHHHSATVPIGNETDSEEEDEEVEERRLERCGDRTSTLDRFRVTIPVSSQEGYLTKLGRIRKTWRVRWFVLRNVFLSYSKTKQSPKPIRTLNMLEATAVNYDYSAGKDFCFKIEFPKRTYILYANSDDECEHWVELLRSKILAPCSEQPYS